MEQLVQLDAAVWFLDRDDRIVELDKIVRLKIQQFLAHLFGLRLGRELDGYEIAHGNNPFM